MNLNYKTEPPASASVWKLFLTTGWNKEYNLTEEEYFNAVKESRFFVSAYDGETLIGYGRVVCDGNVHAMIYDLIVHPSYQGKGAGTKILEKLIDLCRENNIRDIQLFSANGKKEFYEKRGFVPRPSNAPGMDFKPAGKSTK